MELFTGKRSELSSGIEAEPVFSINNLGAVHNCQHLCIRTQRTEGGGGHEASVLIFEMLPPGGYDRETAVPHNGLLCNCCYYKNETRSHLGNAFTLECLLPHLV